MLLTATIAYHFVVSLKQTKHCTENKEMSGKFPIIIAENICTFEVSM